VKPTQSLSGWETFAVYGERQGSERLICVLSSGNLATTQSVFERIDRAMGGPDSAASLGTVLSMFDAAVLLGATIKQEISHDAEGSTAEDIDFAASFLVGGQIKGERMRLFQVYPAGNFIEAGRRTPNLQIGEHKYGKPILDRVINEDIPLIDAVKCTLLSFDSTIRSNLSVGYPIDVLVYKADTLENTVQHQFKEHDAYTRHLSEAWSSGLRNLFVDMDEPPLNI
jgi:putative proteasome-type protease